MVLNDRIYTVNSINESSFAMEEMIDGFTVCSIVVSSNTLEFEPLFNLLMDLDELYSDDKIEDYKLYEKYTGWEIFYVADGYHDKVFEIIEEKSGSSIPLFKYNENIKTWERCYDYDENRRR